MTNKHIKIREDQLAHIIYEMRLKNKGDTDGIIIECIDKEIDEANEYLKNYGMSVTYNSKYDFERSGYSDCLAAYKYGSVKNNGKIRIGINIPLIQSYSKNEKELRKQIEVSIWHEIGHGIIEFLKGLRRKDTQCRTKIFIGNMLRDFKYIINNEEFYAEEFGNAKATNGMGLFSEICDFLNNYEKEISNLRNNKGGSKWMQHFNDDLQKID